jgi:hypothetical protein
LANWSQHIRVHEAAHAVAGYLLGKRLRRINVRRHYLGKNHVQGKTKWSLGRFKLERPRGLEWTIPKSVRKELFAAVSGGIAEFWFFDRARYHGLDWNRAFDFMKSYVGNEQLAARYFHEVQLEAVDWFAKARYMKAVAAVANALKAKPCMGRSEVERIIQRTALKPLKKWKDS